MMRRSFIILFFVLFIWNVKITNGIKMKSKQTYIDEKNLSDLEYKVNVFEMTGGALTFKEIRENLPDSSTFIIKLDYFDENFKFSEKMDEIDEEFRVPGSPSYKGYKL